MNIKVRLMGRAKKVAVIGKLRLKYLKNKYDTDKTYPIVYEYLYNRKAIRRNSPFKAKVEHWNQSANNGKGGLLRGYGDDYIRDTNKMLSYLSTIDDRIRDYAEKHPNKLNPDIIHSLLYDEPLTRQDEGKDFIDYVKDNLKQRYNANDIKLSRYENGLSCMEVFSQFLVSTHKGTYKPNSIYLGEIDGDLIDDYIDYRKNVKGNSDATINHSLTPIIIACRKAAMRHLIPEDIYDEIKDKRVTEDASSVDDEGFDGKYLNKEGIKQLIDFYSKDIEIRRKEYIEMFLFAFYAGGLRLVDIMTLQWKHIDFDKNEMKKTLIKSLKYQKKRNTVPLTAPALQILNKWKNMKRREKFVFDLVQDDFDINNEEARYKARNSVNKKVNQALKVVGEKMELPFSLHFHTARHSFAINALNDAEHPMDMYQVSRLLGHTSTNVTEKVYADYIGDTLTDKMNDLQFPSLPTL